ncbi:MAG TPA: NUDIX domain-containing protein, partial [Candidatus Nitrosopolaris sp.]|nr:NUDIX domain-containing protein [Candidatus Nitrosopolaris sp.]
MDGVIPPEKRFKLILSVYLILVQDGKTLLLRRQNTGYEDGNYGLVAGHADGNEVAREALCREVLEESGLKFKPEDFRFVHLMHRKANDERIDVFFTADSWQGEPEIMEPEKCDDLSWFSLDNLPKNTIPYIRQAIECSQKDIYYSEHGWTGNT